MKKLLTILLLCGLNAGATTYYVSLAGASGATGTSTATAWDYARFEQAIESVVDAAIQPGDSVLFRRGDRFEAPSTMVIAKSGTISQRIYFGAYGTGPMPIISGLTRVTQWVYQDGNIWESLTAVSAQPIMQTVTVGGRLTPKGRWPNPSNTAPYGYFVVDTFADAQRSVVYLPTAGVPASPNLTGGEVVHRYNRFMSEQRRITGHTVVGSRSALTLESNIYVSDGYGLFIQDHPMTLDQQGEWWYDRATRKLRIYSATDPMALDVRVARVEDLLTMSGRQYLTFEDMDFEGANRDIVSLNGTTSNINFNRCQMQYAGQRIVQGNNHAPRRVGGVSNSVSNITLTNCQLWDAHNFAVDHWDGESNWTVTNCDIRRIGIFYGHQDYQGSAQMGAGIRGSAGNNHTYTGNRMDSIGYSAFRWNGANVLIERNYLTNYCITWDDAGAIYTGNSTSKAGSKVQYNIVIGNENSTAWRGTDETFNEMWGLYADDNSRGDSLNPFIMRRNIVVNNSWGGIYLHNNINVLVDSNIVAGNKRTQIFMTNDGNAVGTQTNNPGGVYDDTMHNVFIKHNVLLSDSTAYNVGRYYTLWDSTAIRKLDEPYNTPRGSNLRNGIDSNYLLLPTGQSGTLFRNVWFYLQGTPQVIQSHTLAQWRTLFGHDLLSKVSPVNLPSNTPRSQVYRMLFNAGSADSAIALPRPYISADGDIYYGGTVTLKPFEGLLLLPYDGAPPPVSPPPVEDLNIIGYRGFRVLTLAGRPATFGGKVLVQPIPVFKQNLYTWSEQLQQPVWVPGTGGVSVTANISTAPDGTQTADRITTITGTSAQKGIRQAAAAQKDTVYTMSAYVRDVSRRYVQLYLGLTGFGSQAFANYDLQTGTVTLQGASVLEAGIESKGSGWYEVWVTARATATAASGVNNTICLITSPAAVRAQSYNPATAASVDLWGVQWAKDYKRRYTKTEAAAIQ